jgi:hypothetical protein
MIVEPVNAARCCPSFSRCAIQMGLENTPERRGPPELSIPRELDGVIKETNTHRPSNNVRKTGVTLRSGCSRGLMPEPGLQRESARLDRGINGGRRGLVATE